MNRELGGDFDLAAFRHHAFYNVATTASMHLESLKHQTVTVAGGPRIPRRRNHPHREFHNIHGESFRVAESAGWRPSHVGPTRTTGSPCMR
jgi:hypothetical protein